MTKQMMIQICRLAFLLALALMLDIGCAPMGKKLVSGIYSRQDSLAEAVRPAARAIVTEAGKAFQDSVQKTLEAFVGHLQDSLKSAAGAVSDSFTIGFNTLERSAVDFSTNSGNEAVNRLLRDNLGYIRKSLDGTIDSLGNNLAVQLRGQLSEAIDSLTRGLISSATAQLASDLRNDSGLGGAIVQLGGKVVRQGVTAIDSERKKPMPWWFWVLVVLVVVNIIAVIGRFILSIQSSIRDRELSLRLVSRAVQESGDANLAQRITNMTAEHGVGGWYKEWLDKQGLRLEQERRAKGGNERT